MDSSSRAPIPSPHDNCALSPASTPSLFTSICGHFFGFGFFGQIIYTVLELAIASQTHGQTEAPHSVNVQLALLGLPLACAVLGVVWSCKWPNQELARPAKIGVTIIGIALLGMFNFLVMFFTAFTGYC